MHVSMGELTRLAPDALRGLQFSSQRANRAAPLLVWGEAVHGASLRFLAARSAEIEEGARSQMQVRERSGGPLAVYEVDAAGKSVLETGPIATDLAHSRMDAGVPGLVLVRGTFGTFLAGELISRCLKRGRAAMVACSAPQTASAFDAGGLLLGLPGKDGANATFAGALDALDQDTTERTLEAAGLPACERDAAIGALSSFAIPGAEDGRLAILSWIPPGEPHPSEAGPAAGRRSAAASLGPADSCWRAVDFAERVQAAIRDGLDVDEAAWSDFHQFIGRTRVVTSERSRAQAG